MKTDIRQEQIIDEAINIIHTRGYYALSIRELAKKVEISEGAIYKHFSGKEEIISGIIKRILSLTNVLFDEIDAIHSTEAKLHRFIFFHLELFEKKPELVSIMFSDELFELKSNVSENIFEIMKKRQTLLRNLVSIGVEEGKFKEYDCEIISTMIQGYIKLTISKWKHSNYGFPLAEQGEKFYKTLEQILIKK
jgi:AcrR family transcriptional regulator